MKDKIKETISRLSCELVNQEGLLKLYEERDKINLEKKIKHISIHKEYGKDIYLHENFISEKIFGKIESYILKLLEEEILGKNK